MRHNNTQTQKDETMKAVQLKFESDPCTLPFGLCPHRLGWIKHRKTGEVLASIWSGGRYIQVTTADLLVTKTMERDINRDSIYTIIQFACLEVLEN